MCLVGNVGLNAHDPGQSATKCSSTSTASPSCLIVVVAHLLSFLLTYSLILGSYLASLGTT